MLMGIAENSKIHPKMEVPTRYFWPMIQGHVRGYAPKNMALYGTVAPFWDPGIPIDFWGFHDPMNHNSWLVDNPIQMMLIHLGAPAFQETSMWGLRKHAA